MDYQTLEVLQQERQLLTLLQKGDEWAFEQLYRKYSVRILRKLIRFTKDEEIAKELLQDVFLKVWEKRESIDPAGAFRSYLFRIASNKSIDFFRRTACNQRALDHLIHMSTELCHYTQESIDFKEGQAILQEAISALPPQRKRIFILCKMEGKSYEEAGNILGISTGTVNDHMVKAIRSVRRYLHTADLALPLLLITILR